MSDYNGQLSGQQLDGAVLNTRKIAGIDLKDDVSASELRNALNVENGANKTTVDNSLSSSSTNPVQNKVIKLALDAKGTYSKPSGGIPKTDLESDVQTSLNKADSAATQTQIQNLQSQIDEIITPVTEDAEVQNARVNVKGVTHATLKERCDSDYNQLNEDLLALNCAPIFTQYDTVNNTNNGITFTWTNNICHATGTATATATSSFYLNENGFPLGINAGDIIHWYIDTSNPSLFVQVYYYKNNSWVFGVEVKENIDYKIPTDATGLLMRVKVSSGATVNDSINFKIINTKTNKDISEEIEERIYSKSVNPYISNNSINLSDVTVDGYYIIPDSITITDAPDVSDYRMTLLKVENYNVGQNHGVTFICQTVKSHMYPEIEFTRVINHEGVPGQWVKYLIISGDNKPFVSSKNYLGSCDVNTLLKENVFYLLVDSRVYENLPNGYNAGFLTIYSSADWTLQVYNNLSGNKEFKRRATPSGTWSDWVETTGGQQIINNYTNEYNTPHYENTYNVTATPNITTDTNNYLAPTGNLNDVTASIATMLSESKVCRLGTGIYCVKNLEMPSDTTIIGSGAGTIIRLLGETDSSEGYTVKMNSRCTIKNLTIEGWSGSIAISENVINRHGILWEGNASEEGSSTSEIPVRGTIENVIIRNFTGGGITCYNTGYGTSNCLNVSDVYIYGCRTGINISYWSEFHRFTNCHSLGCYYGCINNGGNNIFVNCGFSGNKLGMLMDNSTNQSPNNAHGSAIGCVFNHTDSNNGIGIKIINCKNGFTFVGCQIFFSQIYLEDVEGFNFSDGVFGQANNIITVKGGGLIMFNNNQHQGQPTISIENNNNVHFTNCYIRSTGAVVSN